MHNTIVHTSSKTSNIDAAKSIVSFRIKKIGFLTLKGTLGDFSGKYWFWPKRFDKFALQK